MKKPPLTEDEEAFNAQVQAAREKRHREWAERGPRKPILPGGTFEKKWQEPFLAGAFPDEPPPPTPIYTFTAGDAVARRLPPIAVSIDALASALVPVEPICPDALCSLAGPNIALHVVVGRAEEQLEPALRRCGLVGEEVARVDTTSVAIAGVAVLCTCFTWRRGEAVRASCAGFIDVGGAPVLVVLECGAGLMARPKCSQVLVTGMLGAVAQALRIELVGA